jgi:hypothetical protein
MDQARGLIVGLLLGAVLVMALPASAHHTVSAQRLQRRLSALTQRVSNLSAELNDFNNSVNSRLGGFSSRLGNTEQQVTALNNRANTLEAQAQHLDTRGHFFGPIHVWWNNCISNDDATWFFDTRPEYNDLMLGC